MFGLKVNQAKSMFFDAPAVIKAVDKATRKALSRFGAFVRQTARNLIKSDDQPSEPGEPPHSHTGDLKKGILFGYDQFARSVVIGPVKYNAKRTNAPETLEYGATIMMPEHSLWVKGEATRDAFGQSQTGKRQKVTVPAGPRTIEARPFMTPAFEKELPKLPDMWADAVV